MANVQNMLNAAKKQKANGGMTQNTAPRNPNRQMMDNVMATSSDLSHLENLYFNPQDDGDMLNEAYEIYPNGERRKIYDAQEDLKEIASFDASHASSNMPQAILESIMDNPLNIPTEGYLEGNEVNNMMNSLQNRSMDIMDKLDARDRQGRQQHQMQPPAQAEMRQTINETQQTQPQAPVNYNQIAKLIESIIDKKFAQYSKTMLNEGRGQNGTTLSFVKLGDTFTFMDNANNVYECKMVYKGKGKVKRN